MDLRARTVVHGSCQKTKTRFQKFETKKMIVKGERVGVRCLVIEGEDVSAI